MNNLLCKNTIVISCYAIHVSNLLLILSRFISMDGELGLKMGSVRTIILGNNMYAGKANPLDTEVNIIN